MCNCLFFQEIIIKTLEPVKLPKIVKNSFIVLLSLQFSFFFVKTIADLSNTLSIFFKENWRSSALDLYKLAAKLLDCWVRSMISLKIRLVSSQNTLNTISGLSRKMTCIELRGLRVRPENPDRYGNMTTICVQCTQQ